MHIERVVTVQQAVGQYLHLYLLHHRRQSSQGLNQSGIAVNLVVQTVHNPVVRASVFTEVLVVGRHLLQRVGQIERHLLFLGVEQDRELVRLGNHVDHPLMLTIKILVKALLRIRALHKGCLQLRTKVFQRVGQRPSAHHSHQRQRAHAQS